MNKKNFSIVTAFLLALSIISSTAPASASSIPDGQYLGFSTCCGDVITIINGEDLEVGDFLYFQDHASGDNFWTISPGDKLEITDIEYSANVEDFEELVGNLGGVLMDYNVSPTDHAVRYRFEESNAFGYTGGLFSIERAPRNSSNAALLAQAEKLKQDTFILAAATLAIASVSNSLSQLTASLLPKTVCVKKGKKNKYVSALQACPTGYKVRK